MEHFATADSLPFDVRALIRALIALYSEATATVRGNDGCSEMFDINSGTREGGVESPWLYVLFVADLIEKINEVELSEDPIFIGNRKVRVLQFADDLVFLARSESDLNVLLARWSSFCSLNHQETSLSKIVIAIFTNENDEDLQIQDGVATIGNDENFKFVYRDHELTVIEFFV